MLHTVNKSPYNHAALAECLRVCDGQAHLVLIEDGVYAALAGGEWIARLGGLAGVYALAPDVAARGLSGRIDGAVQLIDYAGFVQLCCEHTPIQSWF